MPESIRAPRKTEPELVAEIAFRRARERTLRQVWAATITVGVIAGAAAFFAGAKRFCAPGAATCAEHAGGNGPILWVSGLAALLVVVGIMTWTNTHVYASRTSKLEMRLSEMQQRRESAGFAAQFDND